MLAATFIGVIAVILGLIAREPNKRFCINLSFIVIAIFLCMRYMWGNDMQVYYNNFNYINDHFTGDWKNLADLSLNGFEYGWILFNILCKPIGFWGMQVILTLFEIGVYYHFVKENVAPKWYWLAIFIFCFNPNLMVLSSSMLRQNLAMMIFLLSYKFIVQRQLGKYLLIILLGSLFHKSILLIAPVYLLTYFKFNLNSKHFFWIVLAIMLWFVLAAPMVADVMTKVFDKFFIFNQYQNYINQDSTMLQNGLAVYFLVFMACLLLMSMSKFTNPNQKLIVVLSILEVLIIPLSQVGIIFGRLGFYFSTFSVVSIPLLCDKMRGNSIIKNGTLVLFLLFTLRNFYFFFNDPVWYNYFYNYHSIFEFSY